MGTLKGLNKAEDSRPMLATPSSLNVSSQAGRSTRLSYAGAQ